MKYRKIFTQDQEILSSRHISFIVGPRQVGKTTLLRRLYDQVDPANRIWLNLENFEYHTYFQRFSELEGLLRSQYSGEGIFYLFLDEFQKVRGIDTILKLVYDELPWVKVVASGSNNIEINKNIHESFAGRKRMYTMYPLDFDEFLIWKLAIDPVALEKYYQNPLNANILSVYQKEFMIWGGYPEVVLAHSDREKERVLEGIFDYWFNRDIVLYTDRLPEFKELLKQLSFRMGHTLSYAEIGTLTHLTGPTIKRFISILEEIFLVVQISPFFRNKLKEISRAPKLYFLDPGARNMLIRRFEFSPDEFGLLFENFAFTEMLKRGYNPHDLKFWRTKNEQYEVDMIIELEGRAIECKYRDREKSDDRRGIDKFCEMHSGFQGEILYRTTFWKNWPK